MVPPPARRRRSEEGAVAVLVTVCVLVLLGFSAMAVDLGNAWAQKQQTQTQADLAATAASRSLRASGDPLADCASARAIALEYLRKNSTYSQDDGATAAWTATQLGDGNSANGEVTCPTRNRVRVVSPPSLVQFALAGALGPESTNVAAAAAAEIRSPGAVAPLWLPMDCTKGLQWADVPSGPSTPPAPTSSYTVPTPPGTGTHTLRTLSPALIGQTTAATSLVVTTNNDWPAASTTGTVVFTNGSTEVARVAGVAARAASGGRKSLTLNVPLAVTNAPAQYEVWVIASSTGKYSARFGTKFVVQNPAVIPACGKDSGNFHKLDSPRPTDGDSPNAHDLIMRNIALGLDHEITQFDPVSAIPSDGICASGSSGNNPVPYARVDRLPLPADPPNCILTETGGSGNGITEGFIQGGSRPAGTFSGKLYTAPTSPACGSSRPGLTYLGLPNANNDALSCFIPSGVSMAQIVSGTSGPVLDDDIYKSPRFMWMPIVHDDDFTGTKFEALSGFVPAFITDERQTAGSYATTATNGVYFKANKVDGVAVIAFSPNSLPATVPPGGTTSPYVGTGPQIVSLVE